MSPKLFADTYTFALLLSYLLRGVGGPFGESYRLTVNFYDLVSLLKWKESFGTEWLR